MQTTKLLILACIAVLLVREAWVIAFHIPRGTVSEAVWDVFNRFPVVLWVFGVLCGHFVWQSKAAWLEDRNAVATGSNATVTGETEKDGK